MRTDEAELRIKTETVVPTHNSGGVREPIRFEARHSNKTLWFISRGLVVVEAAPKTRRGFYSVGEQHKRAARVRSYTKPRNQPLSQPSGSNIAIEIGVAVSSWNISTKVGQYG